MLNTQQLMIEPSARRRVWRVAARGLPAGRSADLAKGACTRSAPCGVERLVELCEGASSASRCGLLRLGAQDAPCRAGQRPPPAFGQVSRYRCVETPEVSDHGTASVPELVDPVGERFVRFARRRRRPRSSGGPARLGGGGCRPCATLGGLEALKHFLLSPEPGGPASDLVALVPGGRGTVGVGDELVPQQAACSLPAGSTRRVGPIAPSS